MTTLDPILVPAYPSIDTHPRWYHVVSDLFEGSAASPVDVDTLLEEHSDCPSTLRSIDEHIDAMYVGRSSSDWRARVVGRFTTLDSDANATKIKKFFKDAESANLESIELRKPSELKALLEVADELSAKKIRALEIHFAPTTEQYELLGSHPAFSALETLILRGTLKDGFAALSEMPNVRTLKHLGLWYALDRAPRAATDALAAVEFSQLETFVLTGKNLAAKAVQGRPFLDAPWQEGLRHLVWEDLSPRDDDLMVLSARPNLSTLETLSLRGAKASSAVVCSLLQKLSSCTSLSLQFLVCDSDEDWNPSMLLHTDIAEALVASGCVPNLSNLLAEFSPKAKQLLEANGLDTNAARRRLTAIRGWNG